MLIKFNPEGKALMTLDRRPEPADALAIAPPPGPDPNPGKYAFDRPTDVGWDAAGNIFVSDGYGNSRVVKYDKNGRYITSVGSKGSAPGELNLPHYKMELDGKILGKFGAAGKLPKEFGTVNELDCRNPNVLFAGELTNWRVQRLTLRP